jgi:cytidylate kinase
MKERDARDSEREVAPLRPAVDAYVIDTSDLDPDTVLAVALAHARARLSTMQNNAQDNARNNAQDNAQGNAQDKGGLSLEFPGNPRHQ